MNPQQLPTRSVYRLPTGSALMAATRNNTCLENTITPLSEPVFNEGSVNPDPTRFKIEHPSDTQLYADIKKLLTKDVVVFKSSRLPADGLFSLEEAWEKRGSDVVKKISTGGKIVFHAAGDTGASNQRKYGNEIRVCDQLTNDCRTARETTLSTRACARAERGADTP